MNSKFSASAIYEGPRASARLGGFGRLAPRAPRGLGQPCPVAPATQRPAGGAFVIRCGLLYRRGQGEADRLCVPDGGGECPHPAGVPRRPAGRALRPPQDGRPRPPARLLAGEVCQRTKADPASGPVRPAPSPPASFALGRCDQGGLAAGPTRDGGGLRPGADARRSPLL